jgi:TrmH family RNA methyltransferase
MRKVVLVRPEGPRNVGMVLRTATNFGVSEVVLVAPRRPSMLRHPDFEQMSHGVDDRDERVPVFETLEEALEDCTHAVAFTARARVHRKLEDWREAAPEVATLAVTEGEKVALVFGNEVEGLSELETDLCHRMVHIRTSDAHTSLNLSMAVGIGLFATYTLTEHVPRAKAHNGLRGDARRFLKERLKDVFQGIARSDSIRRDITASVERVMSTAPFETRDGRAWHAILRALGSTTVPADYGIETPQPKGARRDEALERAEARRLALEQGSDGGAEGADEPGPGA